jgi:hypothetical protein
MTQTLFIYGQKTVKELLFFLREGGKRRGGDFNKINPILRQRFF